MERPLIFICSPYRGDVETNMKNARRYCRFAFEHGGIPFAPHLLFTQFLDDGSPAERRAGICLGVELLKRCDALWAFGQPTDGMALEIREAAQHGVPVRRFDSACREAIENE